MVLQNVELQKFCADAAQHCVLSEDLESRLELAMEQIRELIAERTCLQHDNSKLKVDLYALQARIASMEEIFQVCDSSCNSAVNKLKAEKGTLLQELEEFHVSAQRQVDSWQSAAAIAKKEALELKSRADKFVHENQLLLLSLENKVPAFQNAVFTCAGNFVAF